MLDKIRLITNSKMFHIVMLIVIVVAILFVAGIIVLKYNVEGETNMPFKLSKISLISSQEGIDKQATDTKWAFDVSQNNDVYIYIEKNNSYSKTEAIRSVKIENVKAEGKFNDKFKLYKPDQQIENQIFKDDPANESQEITNTGELNTDIKNLKISNQGGIIAFRCAYNNIAEYTSNDDEINHLDLLKKSNINNDDLQTDLSFDMIITLEDGKQYKTTINLNLPVDNVVESGTTSKEITEVNDFIFKRIEE